MSTMNKILVIMKNTRVVGTYQILMFGLVLLVACNYSNNETNLNKIETGSFTDPRDGKVYKTVKIGDQWIMAENLAYKPDTGNFWAYENNDSNIAIYGYLYDWETAMNIAPEGWHLPSRQEWLDIYKVLGAKWKTRKYLQMLYPKLVEGGSSGLDMLFGGRRTEQGNYENLGVAGRFWTSDNSSIEKAVTGLNRGSGKDPGGAFNNAYQRPYYGYSVRLFKNKE